MSESITLDYPVKIGGAEVSQLTMRRPKVRDQIAASKSKGSPAEQEVTLFANLCSVSPDEMQQLDFKDYTKLQEKFTSFLS